MDNESIRKENEAMDLELAREQLAARKRMKEMQKIKARLMKDHGMIEAEAYVVMAHTGRQGDLKQIAEDLRLTWDYIRKIACRPHVRKAIREHVGLTEAEQLARIEGTIYTRQDLQRQWTEMITDPNASESGRLKASELLAKSEILLVDKTIHEGGAAPIKLEASLPTLQERMDGIRAKRQGEDDDDFLQ